MDVRVVEVEAEATYDLRRRVLRGGDPAAGPFPEDGGAGVVHLGAIGSGGALLGVATLVPQGCAARPGAPALRVRGMAVEPDHQGSGTGRALLAAAVDRTRATGCTVLWANARDTALGFYEREGMTVVGDGFIEEPGLPHHLVVADLG